MLEGSNPRKLTAVGNTLYFTADDGSYGEELWRSDGSEDGTLPMKDIMPGAASSTPDWLTAVREHAVLQRQRRHLWQHALEEQRHNQQHRAYHSRGPGGRPGRAGLF